jgi:hypothetical protein
MVDDDMIDLLVTASISVGDVIDRNRPEEVTEMNVLQMRVAASSLDVLSSFWKRIRSDAPSDSDETLTKRADDQSAFIDKLLQIVSGYANSRNDSVSDSKLPGYRKIATLSYLTSALEILTNEFVYQSAKPNGKITGSNFLQKFVGSHRLLNFHDYSKSVTTQKRFVQATPNIGLKNVQDPVSLLASFPTMASHLLARDFYSIEDSFDQISCLQWLTGNKRFDKTSVVNDLADDLGTLTRLHHLMMGELRLMESWNAFLEVTAFSMYRSSGTVLSVPSRDKLSNFARDTLDSLKDNLERSSVDATYNDVDSTNIQFLGRTVSCHSDLLLFLLEIGSMSSEPLADLVESLDALTDAVSFLFDAYCPTPELHRSPASSSQLEVSLICKSDNS